MKRDEIIRKICKQFIGNYYNISTYRINILKVTIVRKKIENLNKKILYKNNKNLLINLK